MIGGKRKVIGIFGVCFGGSLDLLGNGIVDLLDCCETKGQDLILIA